jgi:chorismate dehydratase
MTSNALARIILKERYDAAPEVHIMEPNLHDMLAKHDACVLIGDNGMREEGEGLHILDLGLELHRLKNLPFVWALWMGNEGLTPELSKHLISAELWGRANMDRVLADAPAETGLPHALCERYLHKIMHYPLEERELHGLREFGHELHKFGLLDPVHFPALIAADFSQELKYAKEHGAAWAVNRDELT